MNKKIIFLLIFFIFSTIINFLYAEEGRRSRKVAVSDEQAKLLAEEQKIKEQEKLIEQNKLMKEELEVLQSQKKHFYIYKDFGYLGNNFIPSGWMGDVDDIKISLKSSILPFKGASCIKVDYSGANSNGCGWAGVYFQYPLNNWGDQKEGIDLTKYSKLKFCIRGDKGGEVISGFNVGGITGEYPDSSVTSLGSIVLTKKWKEYIIDLAGKDLKHIIGGFSFSMSTDKNPEGFTIYFDEMRFEK